MAKSLQSLTVPTAGPDPLQESVNRLTVELQLLMQLIDELRENLTWVTRNGLPVQPIEHVVVKKMALDPCAKDWGDRLVVKRHVSRSSSPLGSPVLEHIAADLKATFEAIAQGQLEVVLMALDGVRDQLRSGIKRSRQKADVTFSGPQEVPVSTPMSTHSCEKPPPGCLF